MPSLILVIALLTLQASPANSETLDVKARDLFREGSALIDQNHHESMIGTKEGLERGIELIQRANELGYPDRHGAFLRLAEAVHDLAYTYCDEAGEEYADLITYRNQIYQRLLDLYPESAEVLCRNASLAAERKLPGVHEELLRRAVEADPNHAECSYVLGMQLIEQGAFEEGIRLARRGVENSDALIIQSYGLQLLIALRSAGRIAEAKEFDKRFKELLREKL